MMRAQATGGAAFIMSVMLSPLSRILPANAPRRVVSDRGTCTS